MKIQLSAHQWTDLKKLVALGSQAERRLSAPVQIVNGDSQIDIEVDTGQPKPVTITLAS